jgi:tRNA threonylcarbamoyl adenosine modification protein (Sua5/YciO/YrdC/YwlC family)
MKRLSADNIFSLKEVVEVLKNGGVIAYPTDTIYGLGCSIISPEGIERIRDIKGRSEGHPLSILVNYMEDVERYSFPTARDLELMKRHLPGPYTFIMKASPAVPRAISGDSGKVGIRIPKNRISTEISDLLGVAIITTSVNRSGKPPLTDPEKIAEKFIDEIDLILDAGVIEGEASTVVDLTGEEPKILRQGAGVFNPDITERRKKRRYGCF